MRNIVDTVLKRKRNGQIQITPELETLLMKCLRKLRENQETYKTYEEYYNGHHSIMRNYAMNESRSNMKVVVNFFKKFIHDEIAYALGNPVTYISLDGNSQLIDVIDYNFSHWSKIHDQKLMLEATKFGEAYEIQYTTRDNEFKCAVLTPMNCFVIEEGDVEKDVILALHIYKNDLFSDNEKVDVYISNSILHFDVDGSDNLIYVGQRTHIFDTPPIEVTSANHERTSMLDDIKSENDAYNNTLSDLVNEVSDFRQAFLKITGAKITDEEAAKFKKTGILQVPTQASVDYLIKKIDDKFVQNLLEELEEKMYKLASHVDTNEKLQSNLSSAALRSRLISLENKCSLKQAMLETAIKKRLKNFFKFIKIQKGEEYDHRKVKLKLTMNIPSDITALADSLSKLSEVCSWETILAQIPYVENPAVEMQKRRQEQEYAREQEIEHQRKLKSLEISNTTGSL
ncbi:phage portal protein [Bacillus sp. PBIB1]|uniref:phage portal protein n=1 Tax=Bacillus sp. PBIB1 TaxID=3140352 RepID=UPI0031F2EB97